MPLRKSLEHAVHHQSAKGDYHLTPSNTKRAMTIACHNCERVFFSGSPQQSTRERSEYMAAARYARSHARELNHELTFAEEEVEQ